MRKRIFLFLCFITVLAAFFPVFSAAESADTLSPDTAAISADEIASLLNAIRPGYAQWDAGELPIDTLYREFMERSLALLQAHELAAAAETGAWSASDVQQALAPYINPLEDEELKTDWNNILQAFDRNPDVYITADAEDMRQGRYRVTLSYFDENVQETVKFRVKLLNFTVMDDFMPVFEEVFTPIDKNNALSFRRANTDWYEYYVDIVFPNESLAKSGFGFDVNSVNTQGAQQPGYVCAEYGYFSTEMILAELTESKHAADIFIDVPESMDVYTPWHEVSPGHYRTHEIADFEIQRTDCNIGVIVWGNFDQVDTYTYQDKELHILFVGDYVQPLSAGSAATWERVMDRIYRDHLYLMADVQNYLYFTEDARPVVKDPNSYNSWIIGYMEGRYGQIAEMMYASDPSSITREFSSQEAYDVIRDLKRIDQNQYYYDSIHTILHSSARVGYHHGFEMEGNAEFCRLYWQDVFGLDAESAQLFGDLELGAWIEQYQAEYASTPKDISIWYAGEDQFLIYCKGTIIIWCLDAIIKDATNGERDVFDYFIQRDIYNQSPVEAVQAVTGLDISDFWTRFVEAAVTEPLPVSVVDEKPVLLWDFE